jgi:hypothetical protein
VARIVHVALPRPRLPTDIAVANLAQEIGTLFSHWKTAPLERAA